MESDEEFCLSLEFWNSVIYSDFTSYRNFRRIRDLKPQKFASVHFWHFQAYWACFEGDRVLFNIPGLCVPDASSSSEFQCVVRTNRSDAIRVVRIYQILRRTPTSDDSATTVYSRLPQNFHLRRDTNKSQLG